MQGRPSIMKSYCLLQFKKIMIVFLKVFILQVKVSIVLLGLKLSKLLGFIMLFWGIPFLSYCPPPITYSLSFYLNFPSKFDKSLKPYPSSLKNKHSSPNPTPHDANINKYISWCICNNCCNVFPLNPCFIYLFPCSL